MRKRIREQGVSGCLDDPVGVSKSLVAGIKRYDPNIPPFRSWLLFYIYIYLYYVMRNFLRYQSMWNAQDLPELPLFQHGNPTLSQWQLEMLSFRNQFFVLNVWLLYTYSPFSNTLSQNEHVLNPYIFWNVLNNWLSWQTPRTFLQKKHRTTPWLKPRNATALSCSANDESCLLGSAFERCQLLSSRPIGEV